MRKIGWNASIVLLLLGAVVFAPRAAIAQVGGDGTSTRLLNCVIDGHVPDEPARAQQGGYDFAYQSLRGVTDDDRACTVYRLLNAPDQPPTPFRWTLGDETVVDKVRLPRCGGDTPCDWFAFAKYFPGEIDTNLSVLSYGLNADAFEETVETYMNRVGVTDAQVAEAAGLVASSVGTEIQGRFETEGGEPIPLHLIVKSRFEPDPSGATRLVYEIEDLAATGALGAGDVRIAWDVLGAAASGVELDAETVLGPEATIERSADAVTVTVTAEDFVLDETFTLAVFARGDEEPLVHVEMPAYVPVGAP